MTVVASPDGTGASELALDADLASVGAARRFVKDTMTAWAISGPALDDAVLVVSELVTNAVLHARTALVTRVEQHPGDITIGVVDGSDQLPVSPGPEPPQDLSGLFFEDPDDFELDPSIDELPSTGRGLAMIGAISAAWGSDPMPAGGKQVWARILTTGRSGTHRQPLPSDALASVPLPSLAPPEHPTLIAVPVRLLTASNQDFDAVERELEVTLLSSSSDERSRSEAADLLGAVESLEPLRRVMVVTARRARRRGDRLADVSFDTAAGVAGLRADISDLDTRMRRARERRSLLTPAPPPEVAELRQWAAEEVDHQLAGRAAQPCPFPVIPPQAAPSAKSERAKGQRRQVLLAELSHELFALPDRQAVMEHVLQRTRRELRAGFATVYLVQPDGIMCLGRTGDQEDARRWETFPFDERNPAAEAIRSGHTVIVRTFAERWARYPDLPMTEAARLYPTLVTVPMELAAPLPSPAIEAGGSLTIGFSQARDFRDDDLTFLHRLADLVGDAVVSHPEPRLG